MIMIANLQYAWTLFVKPMQASTHWKLSDIQFAFTLFILFQTWVQPLDGWLIDRLGPRGFISAAGLLCGLGWAGLGYATSLPMLYALYCLAGIGAAFVYSGSIGSALKWFKERRGLASGIEGRIARTSDGGQRWAFDQIEVEYPLVDPLFRVIELPDGSGWAVGAAGEVMRHQPGETAWKRAKLGQDVLTWLRGLSFSDQQNGWMVGGYGLIYRTTDGGKTWLPSQG